MRWIEVTVNSGGDIETLCEKLEDIGAGGLIIEDERDFRNFLDENRRYWDYVDAELSDKYAGISRVKFYLAEDSADAVIRRLQSELGVEPELAFVEDEDWENNWKAYYTPIETGEKLLILPEWEAVPDTDRRILRLDPGLSFGTGSHATTRMCLQALERYVSNGARALDIGCGSGILGIAALLLGCGSATGCDIDDKAVDASMSNAALNGIDSDKFTVLCGDILTDGELRASLGGGYGIVLANIVADVLIDLSAISAGFLREDGVMICSGIIEGCQDEVADAFIKAGFAVAGELCEDEWYCLIFRRSQ